MKTIKVIEAPLNLSAGTVVMLDEEQVLSRLHKLEELDAEAGLYEATGELQFKVGEVLGVNPDALPKNFRDGLDEETDEVAEADEVEEAEEEAEEVEAPAKPKTTKKKAVKKKAVKKG